MADQEPFDNASWQPHKSLTTELPDDSQSGIYLMVVRTDSATDSQSYIQLPFYNIDIDKIQNDLLEAHKDRMDLVHLVTCRSTPEPSPSIDKRLDQLNISLMLATVINRIRSKHFSQAKKEAQRALKLAKDLNSEIAIARCYYWMGRIEFEQRNMPAAHENFKAARTCVEDDEYPEGQTVEFYAGLSRSVVGEEYRKRVLRDHCHALLETASKQDLSACSAVMKSNKRKRDAKTWELVLRPSSHRSSGGKLGQKVEKSTENHTHGPTVWMVHETADLPRYEDKSMDTKSKGPHSDGMEWRTVVRSQSHPCLETRSFTLRCYPQGLAPRTRPTNIFPPQPGEIILSAQEWENLRRRAKDRTVTMGYLAREMRRMTKEAERRKESETSESRKAESA